MSKKDNIDELDKYTKYLSDGDELLNDENLIVQYLDHDADKKVEKTERDGEYYAILIIIVCIQMYSRIYFIIKRPFNLLIIFVNIVNSLHVQVLSS